MAMVSKKEDIDFLLNLKEEDITYSLLMDMFGEFDGKRKFNPSDIFTVPPNSYKVNNKPNKSQFTTTAGLWIFNKLFVEKELTHVLGYINKTITNDVFEDLNKTLSYALDEDRITLNQLKTFLMKTQFTTPLCTVISPNYSEDLLMLPYDIKNKKKELFKGHEEELRNANGLYSEQVEKELISYAKDKLKDDPALDIYNSGARGTFGNNFKNMYIMKGVMKDVDPSKGYNTVLGSYMEGVSAEEFPILAKGMVDGSYSRSCKTAEGGYREKQFVAALQHVIALPKGSDCGTKRTITMTLDSKNLDAMMYSYMVEGSRLVRLDSTNRDKYKGKTVKFRYASLCESKDGLCNKCIGDLFYINGIENIGLSTAILPAKLKLKAMKAFHDSVVVTSDMDVEKAFGFDD